jgi:sporulation protein YlmC with PRC-barrel domain
MVVSLCVGTFAQAEPDRVDPEAAEMVAELLGAPVFAKDGIEVGEVEHVTFDEELQPKSLRITTGAILGIGSRTLRVPKDAFMPVRGAVFLRVPASDVQSFPEVAKPSKER